jgi:hypothetical protein
MASLPSKSKTEYLRMSFGEVLGNALKYWISGFRYYFPLYLLVQLGTAGLAYGLILLSAYNPWILLLSSAFVPALGLSSLLSTIFSLFPIDFIAIGFIGFFIVFLVINMALQLLVTGTVIQHSADTHAGLKPSIGQSFRFARTRVVSLLGATVLSTLITLSFLAAPFAVLGISLLGILVLFWNPFFWLVLIFAVLALSVASVVLLIYVIVRLSVFAPAVVLGGASAAASLRQSWKLVHGHFWRVFAIIIIIGLLVAAIGSLPLGLTMFFIFLPISPLMSLVFTIIYAVVNACTMPLSPLAQTMLYEDLFARCHGA